MTEQEIFDTVAVSLINQGRRSINENGACKYRSPEGFKCAVGFLIPDEKYKPKLESMPLVSMIKNHFPELLVHTELLNELRVAHDTARDRFFTEDIKTNLKIVAIRHNLSDNCLR